MPGHVTHNNSYLDVYRLLPEKMRQRYAGAWERYKPFAQGHDFLLLYMFLHLPQYPKVHNKLKIIEEAVQELVVQYVHALRETGGSDESVMFLYGYLVHHFMDAKLHPLIIYETGDLQNDKNASALHLLVENMIDAYLLRKDGVDPKKFKIHELIASEAALSAETRAIIDASFKAAFGLENFSELFADYNKTARTFFKALRYDPRGIKRLLFKPLDVLLMGVFKPSILPCIHDGTECLRYLNLEKELWTNPADAKVSTQSFDELYDEGVREIARMLSLLDEAIANNAADRELRAIIPEVSSLSGCASGPYQLRYVRGSGYLPVEPKPPAPLAVSSSASDHS